MFFGPAGVGCRSRGLLYKSTDRVASLVLLRYSCAYVRYINVYNGSRRPCARTTHLSIISPTRRKNCTALHRAHRQAQTGEPFGGEGGTAAVAEKFHPIPPSSTGGTAVGGLPLPTGGVLGPLAPHGVLPVPTTTTTTPAQPAGAGAAAPSSALPQGGGALGGGAGGASGGISAATKGGGVSVAWGRGAYAGAGATGPPRRQRHKVSSKDLTEEQRIERR